eukprot:9225896-Pyramimonas_sp.AAC.1
MTFAEERPRLARGLETRPPSGNTPRAVASLRALDGPPRDNFKSRNASIIKIPKVMSHPRAQLGHRAREFHVVRREREAEGMTNMHQPTKHRCRLCDHLSENPIHMRSGIIGVDIEATGHVRGAPHESIK